MREYQEEMKKKEEDQMQKCEEMHTDKIRRFYRLLDLEKKFLSRGYILEKMGQPVSIIVHNTFVLNNL